MILEIILWLAIIEIIGFISLPLTFLVFSSLKDKGYGLSKIIGVFTISFFSWILSFFLNYNISIFVSLIFFSLANFYISKKINITFNKHFMKITEIIFISSFMFFAMLRSLTPAAEGLEKLFDMSLINGILTSEKMPPKDPWFSGYNINYYYFGHFVVATLTKLSYLPSYITFNLALATIYSFLTVEIFILSYNITGKIKFGFLGIFLFIFLGNLVGFLQILTFLNPSLVEFFGKSLDINYTMTCCHSTQQNFLQFLITFPVWSSTRVIPNTINEFPYANFLFGEVHSHILSLPVQLIFICFIFVLYKTGKLRNIDIVISALILSMLYITNTWDLPIYFILLFSVLLLMIIERKTKIVQSIYFAVACIFLFVLLSSPYLSTVKKTTNFGIVHEKSNIFHELILFPVFLYSIIFYYLKKQNLQRFFFILLFSFILYILTNVQIIFLLMPIMIFSFLEISKKNEIFANVLIFLGCLAMLSPEIFYIDSRYNTVFKFYYHIWIFWSISTIFIINELKKDKIFVSGLIFLIILCIPMTVFASIDRINQGLNEGISLNGLNYMRKYHSDDYNLLMWAIKNIEKDKIILEASGDAFTYTSIFSSYTGLQTPLGWNNHVGIHHNIWPEERMNDIKTIYETSDLKLTKQLLEKYNISYVFVGSVEWLKYPKINIEKFGNPIFSSGNEFIFKVN